MTRKTDNLKTFIGDSPPPLIDWFKNNALHCKKKVADFPVPSRDVITKLSLVIDILAGDGKIGNIFLQCTG
jgi:hypothetical protein